MAVPIATSEHESIRLFLCGDVMTGRGVDQILRVPGNPRLFEPDIRSALEYVELAQRVSGPIPRRVETGYIWGDALAALAQTHPDGRIINLETAVTARGHAAAEKNIHYRMHPANVPCLSAAKIDCCVLANNHVLDWGRAGLEDTLEALHGAGIATAGAGMDEHSARAPGVIDVGTGKRVLVYGLGAESSGVPREWRASPARPGVNWVGRLAGSCADRLSERIGGERRAADRVVVSIHWGGNWGYEVSRAQREFAHRLIDAGVVDVVHGHSSHHPKGIEVYRRKLILYGCGDFLNDYEGIRGYESFRPDLTLMYFPQLDAASGDLLRLTLVPMKIHRLQVKFASAKDASWLARTLTGESRRWGTHVLQDANATPSLSGTPSMHLEL